MNQLKWNHYTIDNASCIWELEQYEIEIIKQHDNEFLIVCDGNISETMDNKEDAFQCVAEMIEY